MEVALRNECEGEWDLIPFKASWLISRFSTRQGALSDIFPIITAFFSSHDHILYILSAYQSPLSAIDVYHKEMIEDNAVPGEQTLAAHVYHY